MGYTVNEQDSSKLLLTALNTMLQVAGELPLETTDELNYSEMGKLAEMTLLEVKKNVLAQGWDFNTDESYLFPPSINGMINIPYNVLDITAENQDIVMREWKLYNKADTSFEFTEAVPCRVVWDMDFNNLTHPLRYYITIKAARVFQARTIGDTASFSYSQLEEEEAYGSAKISDERTGKYNMFDSDYGVENWGLR